MDDLRKLPWWTLGLAFAILLIFGVLSWCMLNWALTMDKGDQFRWDRLLVIYSAFQSLGFAAAGVLLGTTVQQARVTTAQATTAAAQARAQVSDANAAANATDADKARAARRLIDGLRTTGVDRSTLVATDDADRAIVALAAILADR